MRSKIIFACTLICGATALWACTERSGEATTSASPPASATASSAVAVAASGSGSASSSASSSASGASSAPTASGAATEAASEGAHRAARGELPIGAATGAKSEGPAQKEPRQAVAAAADKVLVYYFHGARRCRTCVGIQQTVTQTMDQRFAREKDAGKLVFQEINYEQPENRHFAETYDLGFSTMVVAATRGASTVEWENCTKVWEHARNPSALADYAEDRVRTYLAMLEAR